MADERAQLGTQTILAAVSVVVLVFIGTIIIDKMDDSIGSPADPNLTSAKQETLGGFGDMASLVAPLLLVSIAVVIIGLLRRVS